MERVRLSPSLKLVVLFLTVPIIAESLSLTSGTELISRSVTQYTRSKARRNIPNIRIRSSIESDLPSVADILSKAAVKMTGRKQFGFMAKLDQLLARHDIEKLLKGRNRAIKEAQQQLGRHQLRSDPRNDCRLSVLWKSDTFRKLVYRAACETGEPNLWRNHNYQLPPGSEKWLQHAQLTACMNNSTGSAIIGFCEVAMLVDPSIPPSLSSAVYTDANSGFAPAILNLCVDESYRRQGVAKRMMIVAEYYVRAFWGARKLGLYVHKDNFAARTLYERMGYRSIINSEQSSPIQASRLVNSGDEFQKNEEETFIYLHKIFQ